MSQEHVLESLYQLFASSCLELFEGFGCNITALEDPPDPLEGVPMAYIDAGSDALELALILCIPLPVLALTYPSQDAITAVDDAQLEDWISELANQLVGRFKNKLLNYQVTLKLGLPTAYFDADFDELVQPDFQHRYFSFQADFEQFFVCLSVDILDPALQLTEAPPDDGAGEGELELF